MVKRDERNAADEFYIRHHWQDLSDTVISKTINLRVNLVREFIAGIETAEPATEEKAKKKTRMPKNSVIKSQTGQNIGAMLTDELREDTPGPKKSTPQPHIFRFEVNED